jgi:hypothetical protein
MAKLSPGALAKHEFRRNLGEELLAAAREIKVGSVARVRKIKLPEILEARLRIGLSQQIDEISRAVPDGTKILLTP